MEKTERKMTPKGFLHKARIAKSAQGFFQAHKEYIATGELAPVCGHILAAVDSGEVLPMPALNELINVVFFHILKQDTKKGEEKIARQEEKGQEATYMSYIKDENGVIMTRINDEGEVEDLVKGFDNHQRALEWCDRRLFEGASDWHGEVLALRLLTKAGTPMTTWVNRADSIARILKKPRGAIMHTKKASSQKLSFGVKVKNDVFHFSRG